MGRSFLFIVVAAACTFASILEANAERPLARPTLHVRPNVSVSGPDLTLGSIATISAQFKEFEPLVEKLKQISLGDSPAPRTTLTLPGVKILAAIQAQGIDTESLGYSIPATVEIERQGTVITPEVLLPHVSESLRKDAQLDVQVREVTMPNAHSIPVGDTRFEIERLGEPQGGKVPLRIAALVNGLQSARFLATAIVDDWREIPVLNKAVERGMLIQPEDVELVRLNLHKQPTDVAANVSEVLGRRAKSRLGAGTTIRRSLVDVPPLVPQGKRVKMIFQKGGLQATATGIVLEDGFEGSIIKVRNDRSRRVVQAKVLNAAEVGVTPE